MTDAPARIQLRRTKGWRMPPGTVKVDRTTKWGNPFVVGKDGHAAQCVALFEQHAATLPVEELRGKNLACWCRSSGPCHADVLLSLANKE